MSLIVRHVIKIHLTCFDKIRGEIDNRMELYLFIFFLILINKDKDRSITNKERLDNCKNLYNQVKWLSLKDTRLVVSL